jgi:hypothetical protein
MKNTDKTPDYYKGKVYGYKAFDIIEDYELNIIVLLHLPIYCGKKTDRKHKSPTECLQKAIDHLNNEIKLLDKKRKKNVRISHI